MTKKKIIFFKKKFWEMPRKVKNKKSFNDNKTPLYTTT
jgi:hypothetical protein